MSLAALQYVRDLLARMNNDGVDGNDRSVAINAHDEARSLQDSSLIPIFLLESHQQKDQYKLEDVCFVLNCLGRNCHSPVVYERFLEMLRTEKRAFMVEALLKYLHESEFFRQMQEEVLTVTLPFAGHANYGVLSVSCKILGRYRDPRVVNAMVAALKRPRVRPYQVLYILNSLAVQQASAAREAAQGYLESKQSDEALGAVRYLATIEGAGATSMLVGKLTHGSADVRRAAMEYLCRFGDASAVPDVARLLLERTSRSRKTSVAFYQSFVCYAALYLARHAASQSELVQSCFVRLRHRNWKYLSDKEMEFVELLLSENDILTKSGQSA